jgi:hypothetical protein
MTNPTHSSSEQSSERTFATMCGTNVPFDSIQDPGAYICNWSGHLLRVPPDGVQPGRSPLINMVGWDPLYVTKISDNPFITVTKARLQAANFDLPVNF